MHFAHKDKNRFAFTNSTVSAWSGKASEWKNLLHKVTMYVFAILIVSTTKVSKNVGSDCFRLLIEGFLWDWNGWYWQPLPVLAEIPVVWAKTPLAQCCVPVTERTGTKPPEVISPRNFSDPVCTFKCLLSQGVPHWAATSKRSHFSASLIPFVFFVSTLPFLGAEPQFCVSAACWGHTAFMFVLQLEADRGVPVWPDLPVWEWKVLCATQEWWASSGQHLLCASERVSCVCSKEDSGFLFFFSLSGFPSTLKEERCKLTRF